MSISSLPDIEKRIEVCDNKSQNVKNYDEDNLYPQNMNDISNASGTTKSCINLYAKHITGKGFKNPAFYKAKINDKGLTPDKLLRRCAKKYAGLGGYAVHVNYNALLGIVDVKHIPFEYCRLGIGSESGKIAVYENWDGLKGKFNKDDIKYFHPFNTNKEVLLSQIGDDITAYQGQVLWRSKDGEDYPLCPFDAVVEDVVSDSEIKRFRLRTIRKGFGPDTLVEYGYKFESQEEREQEQKNWGTFTGPDSPSVIIVENENGNSDDKSIKLSKLDVTSSDKMYEVTNKTCKDSIIQAFNQPPILLGVSANGMFNANEIEDSYKFYNSVTQDERIMFEEDFKSIFENFYPPINTDGDYSIDPLEFNAVLTEKPALISTLQVGGTQALKEILVDTALSPIQKVSALQIIFGITLDQAQAMVLGTPLKQ